MGKRLLVLGIGPSQVDLISAAKDMEMEVLACARDANGPGRLLVDEFRQIDIMDVGAVTAYAAEKKVHFVFSMGLEGAIPTIANVSDALRLPSFCRVANLPVLQDKARWREALGDMEGNVPYATGRTPEDFTHWRKYPAILKPVDGSGQRGVYRVNSHKELERVFVDAVKHSRKKELLLEEFVEGPEVSVNTFMHKGCLRFAVISDRISYSEYPGGIIWEHHIPSQVVDDEVEKAIKTLVTEVNRKMGFENGHVYFQLKVQDGSPKLIEFTPRFDGCHMWRLIYESMGIDLRRVALEVLSTGESETLEHAQYQVPEGNFTLRFISDKPGTVFDQGNYEIPSNPLYLEWYYANGDKVKTVTGYLEKVGYIVFKE